MKPLLAATCFLAVAFFLISCGGESTDAQNDAGTNGVKHAEHNETPHTTASADDGLVLNDGKKWQMDDHTRTIFDKMAVSFNDIDPTALDSEGLKAIGIGLMANINELIQGCTMTGPEHDQLHVYLMAYIPAVTALEESGQLEDAQKVQHYLAIYDDYFE